MFANGLNKPRPIFAFRMKETMPPVGQLAFSCESRDNVKVVFLCCDWDGFIFILLVVKFKSFGITCIPKAVNIINKTWKELN